MGRIFKTIRNAIQPTVFFVPFTYYFFLFALALAFANSWLLSREMIPGSSFSDIFKLLIRTGIWFLSAIIIFAFLSVLISYLVFIWKKKKNAVIFSIRSNAITAHQEKSRQQIHITIAPLLKPLLGFIKLRLKYDEKKYSEKFALAEAKHNKLIQLSYEGNYQWKLPEIKEYEVEKIVLYFEDLFQFFSFTVALPAQDRFHTHPFAPAIKEFSISPRKTEDTASRIEELKRVEGEYLNYKNFEDNDDVRRIVWKIYAKNKELVVRIPEILDPYASHAYLYPSFFNSFDINDNAVAEIFFLNYYKSMVWAIYQKMGKQGFALKYVADQVTPARHFNDEAQAVQYSITTSNWQSEKDIKSFAGSKDASVVVVSSFCNVGDIATLLENRQGNTVFILIKLSRSLQHSYFMHLLKWIFIQQEKNDIEKYKATWRLSLLRPRVLQNERKLEALFNKYSKTLII